MINNKIFKRISFAVIFVLVTLALLFPHFSKPPVNPYDTWLHTKRFFLLGNVEAGYSFDFFRTRAEIAYAMIAGFIFHAILKAVFQLFTSLKTKIFGSR